MIELKKGQKIDLTKKDGSGLRHILVGLGWQEAGTEGKKGLLGKLMKQEHVLDIDIDASVFLLGANGRVNNKRDVVFFNNKTHPSQAVIHKGDNLVGGLMHGMDDSEQIDVDLNKVPDNIQRLSFVVNIYECDKRRQHFGMIHNAYIRIVDQDSKTELARYSLTDDYAGCTSIIVGEVARNANSWAFTAIGEGGKAKTINEMMRRYNG